MSFKTFGNKLDEFANGVEDAVLRGSVLAANQTKVNIEFRVFTNTKGIDGQPIGTYKSEAYKKQKRKNTNYSVGTVNLQYSGDLRRSITLGESNGFPDVRFGSEKNTLKGRVNEKRFRGKTRTVFASSEKESDQAIDIVQEAFNKHIKQVFS